VAHLAVLLVVLWAALWEVRRLVRSCPVASLDQVGGTVATAAYAVARPQDSEVEHHNHQPRLAHEWVLDKLDSLAGQACQPSPLRANQDWLASPAPFPKEQLERALAVAAVAPLVAGAWTSAEELPKHLEFPSVAAVLLRACSAAMGSLGLGFSCVWAAVVTLEVMDFWCRHLMAGTDLPLKENQLDHH